jgi:hypothetical protein
MDSFRSPVDGSMSPSLIVIIALLAICLLITRTLREPKMFLGDASE